MNNFFNTLLIANRGEIACRIIKTAKKLGIKTVAIYSEVDKNALHTHSADEAYCIGRATSLETYLDGEKIIAVAKEAGAKAIHPGYGFLSENAEFAEQCERAGILFIGPPSSAINAMASKSAAKKIMASANIPLLPGYHGEKQEENVLKNEAQKIGFPVMLKAAAGGGGKGMRIVLKESEFQEALKAVKREAKNSFNDDTVLIEKYLSNPRHIEIQIFADTHGNCVHLFERDCSIQRRHQKIIEECPAPNLPLSIRDEMAKTAVKVAQTIHYVGAGTIEFLVDEKQNYYFMEMNTRLQVEHPVTEMVTGIDLVEWQIRIACGEKIPLKQSLLKTVGHAIEARLYAEDPVHDFLPATGTIRHLTLPNESQHIRLDTGIALNAVISHYYDPMLAKLIAWGETRAEAIHHLHTALSHSFIGGCKNNIRFLKAIIETDAYKQGQIDTHFIKKHETLLLPPITSVPDNIFILACLHFILKQKKNKPPQTDPYSPWHRFDSWWINWLGTLTLEFNVNQQSALCAVIFFDTHYEIRVKQSCYKVEGKLINHTLHAHVNDTTEKAEIFANDEEIIIIHNGTEFTVKQHDPRLHCAGKDEISSSLNAPMPGTIIAIYTGAGTKVALGDKLIVLEAMKMEHTIKAPANGVINAIHYKVGDMVNEGTELLSFEMEKN